MRTSGNMPVAMPNWLRHLDEEVDNKLVVRLRDGRTLIGILRSYDQYGNLLFESASQRYCAPNAEENSICYSDAYLGCVVVRGENIVLFGRMKTQAELDHDEASLSSTCRMVEGSLAEVFQLIENNQKRAPPVGLGRNYLVSSDADFLNDEPFV